MDWYALSRKIFNYAFEHKECGVYHISIFMWIVELNNRLWWKKEFWLPSNDSCEWLSIGNKNTYLSALRDLEKWGFIKIIQESRNQFCSTIIQICHVKSDTATNTALDTALIRQDTQHWYAIDTIDKQWNQETKKPQTKNIKKDFADEYKQFIETSNSATAIIAKNFMLLWWKPKESVDDFREWVKTIAELHKASSDQMIQSSQEWYAYWLWRDDKEIKNFKTCFMNSKSLPNNQTKWKKK